MILAPQTENMNVAIHFLTGKKRWVVIPDMLSGFGV
jgi:hypothetical protein